MPSVGIRELKNNTSRIMREVREESAEYVVTHRGEAVAVILPVDEEARGKLQARVIAGARENAEYWLRLDGLAAKIDAEWKSELTAAEAVEEQRHDP